MQNTKKAVNQSPVERLRHHVTGAIERGEKQAIIEQTDSRTAAGEAMALSHQVMQQTEALQEAEGVIRSALDVMKREGGNDSAMALLERYLYTHNWI